MNYRDRCVLFSSKAWEFDYRLMASGEFALKAEQCQYPFANHTLFINNVEDAKLVYDNSIMVADEVVMVDDVATRVLDFFEIERDSFIYDGFDGYRYSICELAEIYLAKDFDYIVHIQGDVRMLEAGPWVERGIEILETREDIAVISPRHEQDNLRADTLTDWFSDQCYVLRVSDWRKPGIFNLTEPVLDYYPDYGGNSFERRAGRVLVTTGKKRLWLKDFATIHGWDRLMEV